MSKAMEALERLADTIGGCTCSMCTQNREDAATLRDYITTTEEELENARDVIEEFGAHVEIGSIGHFSAQDAIDGINKAIGPDKKAARIKELDDAIDNALVITDNGLSIAREKSITKRTYYEQMAMENLESIKAYLDGARKVEP